MSARRVLALATLLAVGGIAAAATKEPPADSSSTGKSASKAPKGSKTPAKAPAAKPSKSSSTQPSGGKAAPRSASGPATAQRQQSLQREQQELQVELAKLKRELASAEATRSQASRAVAEAERAISQTNRRLRELAGARARAEQQIAALAQRERDAAERQAGEQRRLDAFLRRQHAIDDPSPLQRLLTGGDANQQARDSVYLAALSRDADASVSQLQQRRVELAALREESALKRQELDKIAADESSNREQLQREQAQRRQALDQLAKQIAGQKQSIARLEQDDKRLSGLLERLTTLLAEQQRREQARARRATPAEPASPPPKGSAAVARGSIPREQESITPPTDAKFGQLRGKLALPVNGTVASRFGTPRRGDGAAGPSWKGVFIRAPEGAEVRAVGDGRVVFADWLRGFGNLLVIDHGDGFLSVYGNNETLLRNTGDRVAVGEVISSVGNTGATETPGLYFELRFQGRPFDPLTWVAAR